MSTGDKKRGRPVGSKTQDIPVVRVIPACCPIEFGGCGSTEHGGTFGARTDEYDGEIHGFAYSSVTRSRAQCSNCGKIYIIAEYKQRVIGNSPGELLT